MITARRVASLALFLIGFYEGASTILTIVLMQRSDMNSNWKLKSPLLEMFAKRIATCSTNLEFFDEIILKRLFILILPFSWTLSTNL